jgi:hypothetical protein
VEQTPKCTPIPLKRTQIKSPSKDKDLEPTLNILSSKETLLAQQEMRASLSQHLHKWLSSKTIPVNNIPNIETLPKFNSGANMTIGKSSH